MGEWGALLKSLSIVQERKGTPKPFRGQQRQRDFQRAQGLLLNVFFSLILFLSMQLLPRNRVKECDVY